ncbi:hypothetical protein BV898_13577 [Hypsibius exemplaris]|uniref:Receptor L-domain domain-containing protein n=1 Tax=Hypsibius exemplaris TaxID=2072580 RepID=A0A1W0WAG0_HYPEX|nr:hypothetical protein BV898_13577 [Hypsibius exemplaris]
MAATFLTLLFISLLQCATEAQQPPSTLPDCHTIEGKLDPVTFITTHCVNGAWPSSATGPNAIAFLPNATNVLTLIATVFPFGDPQPLTSARLPNLSRLRLKNVRSLDASGGAADEDPFPFGWFTSGLERPRITEVVLEGVFLSSVTKEMFDGYTGLKKLALINCGISTIHPRSLFALAPQPGQPAVLTEFAVENDRALTVFPWDVLRPVANINSKSQLSPNNPWLSSIGHAEASDAFFLHKLDVLTITGNDISFFPRAILSSVSKADAARIVFADNPNACGDCTNYRQVPLVRWVIAAIGRSLRLTCHAADGSQRTGDGNAAYFHRNPDCSLGS